MRPGTREVSIKAVKRKLIGDSLERKRLVEQLIRLVREDEQQKAKS